MTKITYPFVLDTLGKIKQTGHELSLYCYTCHHHSWLDTDRLIERFGADHGSMDTDLRPHFFCQRCRDAGREDKNFGFTLHPPGPATGPYARTPRDQ